MVYHFGLGRHRYYLSHDDYQEYRKYTFGQWIQTFFSLMITKISICLLLLRITIIHWVKRPIQWMIWILIVTNVILTFLWIFQCSPVDLYWDKTRSGKCFSKGYTLRVIFAQAIVSILSDFLLATFPIIILCNVRINRKLKIGLCILMGLGVITAGCSIVRTVLNWDNTTTDGTWYLANQYWRGAEITFGIICASLPTFPHLYRFIRGKSIHRKSSDPNARIPFQRPAKGRLSFLRTVSPQAPYVQKPSLPGSIISPLNRTSQLPSAVPRYPATVHPAGRNPSFLKQGEKDLEGGFENASTIREGNDSTRGGKQPRDYASTSWLALPTPPRHSVIESHWSFYSNSGSPPPPLPH